MLLFEGLKQMGIVLATKDFETIDFTEFDVRCLHGEVFVTVYFSMPLPNSSDKNEDEDPTP